MLPVPLLAALAVALAAAPVVERQDLQVALSPETQTARVESRMRVRGAGDLALRLVEEARIEQVLIDGRRAAFDRRPDAREPGMSVLTVELGDSQSELVIAYEARLVEDVAAGERPGQIHNQSVHAHVGPEGVFLADGAAWHPVPLADDGRPALHMMSVEIEPMAGWALVSSGDPAARPDSLDEPVWRWRTPRPVEGLAIAGGRHELVGRRHGDVDVVMHVPAEHAELAPMFVDAACDYLDLYTPLLGPFPYQRFSIVENFFSSGFAYPGFTVLGPRVVAMAPRSLAPGYLDHELVHNWWGNGVYVDPDDGNWCEALTSFCANYFRRIADDGPEAGLAYRRGTLMRLSADPAGLDDGPLGDFGAAGSPGRFVGYDKGAFFFIMLSGLSDYDPARSARQQPWTALREFARANMGRRAGWAQLQAAFETTDAPRRLDGMFDLWVRRHMVPVTVPGRPQDAIGEFAAQYDEARQTVLTESGGGRPGFEIDPQFMLYRVLPPEQIIPTFAGTRGAGGLALQAEGSRPQVQVLLEQLEVSPAGENLLLIGDAAAGNAALINRSTDPIRVGDGSFSVGGVNWGEASQSVLHTMQYPGRPGRFITVFHSNGPEGWTRLRLAPFYTRDTTIIWDGDEVVERRTYEPDRRVK